MYERTTIFSIEQILPLVGKVHFATVGEHPFIRLTSWRYKVYAQKGVTCVTCGLKATHFALERDRIKSERAQKTPFDNVYPWHLNLYAQKDDKEILMTIDHIIPKSKGGTNDMANLQPMCCHCNVKKGNKI